SARLKDDEVRPFLDQCPDALQEIPYEDARSVILGAIEFARQFGFEPDESWKASNTLVEAHRLFSPRFNFGKDGQPLYIQGSHDDARNIMSKLAPFIREGSAHYIAAADEGDETDFDEWCDEVSCLMEDKHFRDARNEIEEMLERYPERWEPLYLKGTCLAMEGSPDQAIPLLNQAIAAEPCAEVVGSDGETGSLGRVAKETIDEFAASILKSDGLPLDQHFAIGRIYDQAFKSLTAGHFDEASRGFLEVLKALPRHVQSYGNLGLAYAGLGERDRAIACLDKAIELDVDYQLAIDNRRILLAAPDECLAVQSMREIDFYGDRARTGSRRPVAARALAR
ncbi:MAG: hypothetical protein DMG46_14950, partial [Acidobacteria bacterium]